MKYRFTIVCSVLLFLVIGRISAQDTVNRASRLTVGGYGEATYRYNFFSNNVFRYSRPEAYKDAPGNGQVDIPHAVLMLGYDFGRGWSFGTEIEFEHGGIEAAVEMENEESGEYEKEIERGGEVALEQFWIQRTFGPKANLRMGHIVVPVGATNNAHLPNEFFGVFRPEGENTILPCTWHETGISFFGRTDHWRYELQLIPSLNSTMFDVSGWANGASPSAYEFRPANRLALAARIDNHSVPGLRLSLSGFVGNTFNNDIETNLSSRYEEVKGTCVIGAFDFKYQRGGLLLRGNADYGWLSDAAAISVFNSRLVHSDMSPYPRTFVGGSATACGMEAGYDLLHGSSDKGRQLFLFARYEYYDSYRPASDDIADYPWTERQLLALGVNYKPIPQIILKGEVGYRMLHSQYNNEPWVALGVNWVGFFK